MRMLFAVLTLVTLAAVVHAQAPIIVGPNGQYLGNLNANRFDPNSVSSSFGRYGSPFSSDSINNPYGQWGSPYSPNSVNNPFAPPGMTPHIVVPNQPMRPGW